VACGKNVFRMASSKCSLIAEFCAWAYIEFLAGIFSWSVVCTHTRAYKQNNFQLLDEGLRGNVDCFCVHIFSGLNYAAVCAIEE
jgi:hypothetical protein